MIDLVEGSTPSQAKARCNSKALAKGRAAEAQTLHAPDKGRGKRKERMRTRKGVGLSLERLQMRSRKTSMPPDEVNVDEEEVEACEAVDSDESIWPCCRL